MLTEIDNETEHGQLMFDIFSYGWGGGEIVIEGSCSGLSIRG